MLYQSSGEPFRSQHRRLRIYLTFEVYSTTIQQFIDSRNGNNLMQTTIHPAHNKINVICTCGNRFTMVSTMNKKETHIEACFKCHPVYTGKRKIATAGNIDKFNSRYNLYSKAMESKKPASKN